MVVLAVGGVSAVAEFGDLGAALGVYGQWWWGDVRWVEGDEIAVQGVEFGEFGVDGCCLSWGVGGGRGEGDGFGGGVHVEGVLVVEVDFAGHGGGLGLVVL